MPPRNNFRLTDIEQESLLLVEGIEDARFFDAFLKQGLDKDNVQIVQVGGKDNFREFITKLIKVADNFPNLRSLGMVRDADDNPEAAFLSLRGALRDAGFPAPAQPWSAIATDGLTVSMAILPDGSSQGDLEELCLRSIETQNRGAINCIESYIDCMKQGGTSSSPLSKAKLYAYLAAGSKPGLRIGEAAESGVWDWHSPAFQELRQFLQNI